MEFLTVKHSMPTGDLLSVLPGLQHYYRETGLKAVIYQRVNLPYGDMHGAYFGASYSIKDKEGVPVTMNRAVFNALHPLLLRQEYIQDFLIWDGEEAALDLDILRTSDTTMPYGNLSRYPFYVFPQLACDLSIPSLDVGYSFFAGCDLSDKILINRTERYNNMLISYTFLREYAGKVMFVGLPGEHAIFCKQHNLDIPHFEVTDFFQLGVALKNCKLFIGNQSMCFQIAENLKITRLLEVCKSIPNVVGCGSGFYDFLHQAALEYYVKKLFNE